MEEHGADSAAPFGYNAFVEYERKLCLESGRNGDHAAIQVTNLSFRIAEDSYSILSVVVLLCDITSLHFALLPIHVNP